MADLRSMVAHIGGKQVTTYIASGNVVFCHAAPATEVQQALAAQLERYAGKPVGVVLRTLPQLAAILTDMPFPQADPKHVACVLSDAPVPTDPHRDARHNKDEAMVPGDHVLYVHYPSGMGRSRLTHPLMAHGTARNLNTMRRMHSLLTQIDGAAA